MRPRCCSTCPDTGCSTPETTRWGRWALVEPADPVGHCPDCGFDSARVHSRPVSRVADVPIAGRLEVRVRKRRLWCDNESCDMLTFTQTTEQLGLRARITTRLAAQVVDALAAEARSVSAVGAEVGVSWPTVMRLVAATVTAVHDPDDVLVRRLGVDEHRFRRSGSSSLRRRSDCEDRSVVDHVHRSGHRCRARRGRRPAGHGGPMVAAGPPRAVARRGCRSWRST